MQPVNSKGLTAAEKVLPNVITLGHVVPVPSVSASKCLA